MGENSETQLDPPAADAGARKLPAGHGDDYGSPTTQQLRIVGKRRRDAEEKLQHHLQEARLKH
ncbi:MAG: hypothetical protein JWO29_1158 [Arthrobacter sp.]|nr:hypothetical protein [Arthrobacter sp.]